MTPSIRRTRLLCSVLALSSACADPGPDGVRWGDRAVEVIDEGRACDDCTIELRMVAVLGDSSDPASVRHDVSSRECMVGRLSTGEFLLSGVVGGGEILMFEAIGGAATRRLGRPGEGPGEFGDYVRVAVGAADTLYVVDDSHGRMQVMTPAGEFVRSFPLPSAYRSLAPLSNGSLLFFRPPVGEADALFHLVDGMGSTLAAFGDATMMNPSLETWRVAPAADSGFWAASIWRYDLYRFDGPGEPSRVLVRNVDWFPPFPASGDFPSVEERQRAPRPPLVNHIWDEDGELLWVYSWVPDRNWEPDVPLVPQFEWARRTFDTMIEVFDLRSSRPRLVASTRRDERLGPVCASPLMYSVDEMPDAELRLRIVRPSLVGWDNRAGQ